MATRLFRFAPSPNGYLHLGHAYSALFNDRLSRESGGQFLLRIEDIDRGRSRPEFEAAITEDLDWLGLDWPRPPRRQSQHFGDYAAALDLLRRRGPAFPCFCARSRLAAHAAERPDGPRDPDGAPHYPGFCKGLSHAEADRRIAAGEPFSLRLDMRVALAEISAPLVYREFHEGAEARIVEARPQDWGDAMIGRRDVPASYHLACVLDDALQGVSDVARGADLEAATSLHLLLQRLLDLPTPDYRHHRLVLEADGRKLSKSKASPALRDFRAQGATPEDIRAELEWRMGA